MLSFWVSKHVEGPGTRDGPRGLATPVAVLPVDKMFADPASPAECCAAARARRLCFMRLAPLSCRRAGRSVQDQSPV